MNNIWKMKKGYTEEEATVEAARCLSCKNPRCETGCPTQMRIRDFILEIKKGDLKQAGSIINSCSSLPSICSIVCPHENQCVGHCILGIKGNPINVGKLERYVTEHNKSIFQKEGMIPKKVAIVGAGPAGISCAKELAIAGVNVEIFEATKHFGGVLMYGIPNYRLDVSKVLELKQELECLNVVIHYQKSLKESEILELKKRFDAVFIATGLVQVKKLGIPNDSLNGVYDALDFLRKVNEAVKCNEGTLDKLSGTTIVVGAGNVAMDAARAAVRMGSRVIVAYRRSLEEAPATKQELEEALEEGVEFQFLTNPIEVIGTNKVTSLKCEKMELGSPDVSGRRRPIGTGNYIMIPCERVISAIGQAPADIYDSNQLSTDHLYICCDSFETNIAGIYAGGDIVLGAKTVVEAMKSGRTVAKMILEKCK